MKLSIEHKFYWAVWSGGVLYSLWCFCQSAFENYAILDPEDFRKGWSFLHRSKDNSDTEWVILTTMFKSCWFLVVLQIFISQILSYKFMKILPLFYASYSIMCLVLIVGKYATMVCVVHVLIMYAIHTIGKKILCYFFMVVALYILHMSYLMQARELMSFGRMESFLLEVGLAWQIARCLSFAIDRIDSKVHQTKSLTDLAVVFSYCFYLPTVFTGPIVNYSVFAKQLSSPHRKWNQKDLFSALRQVMRPILCYFALEFMLHYVYSSSVQYYPDVVEKFSAWSLCGLGYALPTLFYVKYFAIYGFAGGLARLEHFELPPPPKCISRIHRSSFLWRHFDRGLYLWILRYLYLPLVNGNWTVFRRVFALSLCFTFVCVWHGMDKAVCTWSALNFFAVASEMLFSYIGSFTCMENFDRSLSASNQRRCRALISTPHFIIMCCSATFFLSNWDVGVLVWRNIICGGFIPLVPTAFIIYCGCHVAMDVKEAEDKGQRLKIINLKFLSKKANA